MTDQFPPAPPTMGSLGPPATFGQRLVAVIIDSIIGFVLLIPAIIIFTIGGAAESGILMALGGLLYLVGFLALFYMIIGGVGKTGQSPGKRMQGVKVVDSNGGPIGIGGAIIRYIVQQVSNTIACGLPIGSLWMLWDAEKKTLYDKILNNQAISVPKGSAMPIFPDGKPF